VTVAPARPAAGAAATLDPQAQALLDVMRCSAAPPLPTLTPAQAREQMRAALIGRGAPPPLHLVSDVALPAPHGPLGLRLYRPAGGPLPVALFLHGGGWTVNDLDTHDRMCRLIAARSGWLLAALDYRRAPEHPHPAVLEDALLAYRWLIDSAHRIGATGALRPALIGESAGGTTAASLSLLLRDLGAPSPSYQALAYPATDQFDRWPSYRERGTGYTLTRDELEWYFGHYLPGGADPDDPYLFPLAAEDLHGLPPTLVMTAEFDPLRDEGIAYAEKLAAAGIAVRHVHAADQMHGFLLLERIIPRAGALLEVLAGALRASARAGVPSATAAERCVPGVFPI
jgi:acetyl esterase